MNPTLTPIRPPFGFHTTADQVLLGISLQNKRVIVTGGSSGIGRETARALATAGADVTLAVRNLKAGERVAAEIRDATRNPKVRAASLDLSDRLSISAFHRAWRGPLNVLVNNAGIMALPDLQRSSEGCEMQFAVNHLGHFELALGLYPALLEGASSEFRSRIVSVSSSAHFLSPVVLDDPHFRFRQYDPWLAYGQSKTANILFAVEANRRWWMDGIFVNACTPGAVLTGLQRHTDGVQFPVERWKTVEQGAANSCLLATSPLLETVGGLYFSECVQAEPVETRTPHLRGVAPYAVNEANAERLWEMSLDLIGKNFPHSFRGALV